MMSRRPPIKKLRQSLLSFMSSMLWINRRPPAPVFQVGLIMITVHV